MAKNRKYFQSVIYGLGLPILIVVSVFPVTAFSNTAKMQVKGLQILQNSKTQNNFAKPDTGFTGKQYYRGIIFGEGKVAEEIPYIRNNRMLDSTLVRELNTMNVTGVKKKAVLKKADKVVDEIVQIVGRDNPGFFKKFKEEMESGDTLTIKHGLVAALTLTHQAAHKTPMDVKAQKYMANHPEEVMNKLRKELKKKKFQKMLKKHHTNKEEILKKVKHEIKVAQAKYNDTSKTSQPDTLHFNNKVTRVVPNDFPPQVIKSIATKFNYSSI